MIAQEGIEHAAKQSTDALVRRSSSSEEMQLLAKGAEGNQATPTGRKHRGSTSFVLPI